MSVPYGQRIRRARTGRGQSLDALASEVGISKAYLSLIETGRLANPPVDAKLVRLESALGFTAGELVREAQIARTPPDIRAALATLAGGVGVNLDAAYLSGMLQKAVDARAVDVETVALAAVPVINRVSAGGPTEFTDLSHPAADADEYVGLPFDAAQGCPGVADPHAFAARVSGQSMAPKYAAGDVVVFSPAAEVRDGDDCYVRLADGRTTFKRVYLETDASGDRVARLQPRNPAYDVRLVPAESITGLYRAVYRYERLNGDEGRS